MKICTPFVLHFLVALLLVAFPKAGVFVGGLPLYFSLLFGTALTVLCITRATTQRLPHRGLFFLYCGVVLTTLTFNAPGLVANSDRQIQLAFNFFSMMAMALVFYPIHSVGSLVRFLRYFRRAYWFILLYGLAQTVLGSEAIAVKNVTALYSASFDEIVNKHNVLYRIGPDAVKMFSTYHNGNLFGIAVVLCLPVALAAEQGRALRFVLFGMAGFVCVLSGSAGAMGGFGLLSALLLGHYCVNGRVNRSIVRGLIVVVAGLSVWLAVSGVPAGIFDMVNGRLLERDFSSNMRWVKSALWWGHIQQEPLDFFIGDLAQSVQVYEVLPLAIVQNFGFVVAALFYLLVISFTFRGGLSFYKYGVVAYLGMSIADGGFWLTPTCFLLPLNIAAISALDRFNACLPTKRRRVHYYGKTIAAHTRLV